MSLTQSESSPTAQRSGTYDGPTTLGVVVLVRGIAEELGRRLETLVDAKKSGASLSDNMHD